MLRSCNVYVLQTTRLTSICLLVLVYLLLLWLPMCIHMPKYTVTIFKFNLVSQREIHLVDMTTITDNDEIQLQDH